MNTNTQKILLLGGFLFAPAAVCIALVSLASIAPKAPVTLQSACVEAVTAKERGNYPDYWVINSDMLTADKARVFYGVARLERETAHLINKGNRLEDRLIATCTGTPESPVVELVSVNAMDTAAAL
jgi:hypothetical protein